MKLFRFIRNLWRGFLGTFGGKDFKDFAKEIGAYLLVAPITLATAYGFGHLARFLHMTWLLPLDKRDDTTLLGVMFVVALVISLLLILFGFILFIEIKKIWNES